MMLVLILFTLFVFKNESGNLLLNYNFWNRYLLHL